MDSIAIALVGTVGVVSLAYVVSAVLELLFCLVLMWPSDLSSGITISSFFSAV